MTLTPGEERAIRAIAAMPDRMFRHDSLSRALGLRGRSSVSYTVNRLDRKGLIQYERASDGYRRRIITGSLQLKPEVVVSRNGKIGILTMFEDQE